MTEEIKTCECKEKCIKKLKEFLFLTSTIFIGTLLAILLAAQILKPKCPMMKNHMMPPPPYSVHYHYNQMPHPPMNIKPHHIRFDNNGMHRSFQKDNQNFEHMNKNK